MAFLTPFVVLLEIFLSILLLIVVLGNIFVIEAVRSHTRLRTIPNICITSLAVSDLFVGLINIPIYMYTAYHGRSTLVVHKTLNSFDIFFGVTSILHLTFISMERCYAITLPLKRKFLQKGKALRNDQ